MPVARVPGLDVRLWEAGEPLPLEDASVDVVWAGEVIEHVVDVAPWLSEIRRVLRPRGALLLTTPNHGPLTLLGLALSRRRFAEHFEPRSDHCASSRRRTLRPLLDDLGFDVAELRVRGSTILVRAVRGRPSLSRTAAGTPHGGVNPRAMARVPDARPARHHLRAARAERHRDLPAAPQRGAARRGHRRRRGGRRRPAATRRRRRRQRAQSRPRRLVDAGRAAAAGARRASPTSCTTRCRRSAGGRRARRSSPIHDLAFERLPECFAPGFRRWASVTHRLAARGADAVVCVSQTTRATRWRAGGWTAPGSWSRCTGRPGAAGRPPAP